MSHLPPAYQGVPYYQPGPPSRRRRALKIFLRAVIVAGGLVLVIITGAFAHARRLTVSHHTTTMGRGGRARFRVIGRVQTV